MDSLFVFLVSVFCLIPQLSLSFSNAILPSSPLVCDALLLFKSSFVIDPNAQCPYGTNNFPRTASWKNDTNCCHWHGVECDKATGHVIGLELDCGKLVGTLNFNNTLFSTHIAPYLQILDLSHNDFLGSQLDVKFGSLISLRHLDLSSCNISGPIPSLFGNLTALTYLDLSSNNLSGPIPAAFSNLTHLVHFGMSDNELEGPLPCYLFALRFLRFVDLSNNKLYGHIPTSPIKSMILRVLYLSNNNLNDSIDFDVFLNFRQLRALDLSDNNISSISTFVSNNLSYPHPNFVYLSLSSCNLNQFPTFIRYLINLTYLDVSNNQIQGSIPYWIYDVGKYTMNIIDLSGNYLSSVGHLDGWKYVEAIDFHSNLLQGPLPIPPPNTRFFSVSNNNIFGEISSSICNLTYLGLLDLSHNQFIGRIPKCIGNSSHLSMLNLGMNKLYGVIPNTFAEHNDLDFLILKGNQLTGTIPPSLAYCDKLKVLDLSNNMIKDIVSHWLQTLSSLRILVLKSNKFFGSLNSFKVEVSFPMLRILDLSHNNFTGTTPIQLIKNLNAMREVDEKLEEYNKYMDTFSYGFSSGVYYSLVIIVKRLEMEYVKIMATFAIIDLSRNKFEGHIPKAIGKLISLKGLNLSHNMLSGPIPSSIGNINSLEWLDLSFNQLSGQIPIQLADLTFLEVLDISHNQLYGPIPQGKQLTTFENGSYKDNLALCGFPLSSSCRTNHEPPSFIYEDKYFSNSENGFSWESAYAGCGCGVVLVCQWGVLCLRNAHPNGL